MQPPSKEEGSGLGAVNYTKLESAVVIEQSEALLAEKSRGDNISYPIEDSVYEAFLAFLISTFNLVFSLGIAYWHYGEGNETAACHTLTIVFISAITIQLAYAFNR